MEKTTKFWKSLNWFDYAIVYISSFFIYLQVEKRSYKSSKITTTVKQPGIG